MNIYAVSRFLTFILTLANLKPLETTLDSPPPSAHHGDLTLGDVTAVRQDGKNGGRVQKPINHMDDPIGSNNVGARQMDALLAQ